MSIADEILTNASRTSPIIEPSPYFQRSISLDYDLNDPEFIDFFVPTSSTVEIISKILDGTTLKSRDRSHVILGAYGTGKSLAGLVLGSLFNPNSEILPSLNRLCQRLTDGGWKDLSFLIQHRLSQPSSRLLPVILNGNEGELTTALLRACRQAIQREEIGEINLTGLYEAVLKIINLWEQEWPQVYSQLERLTRQELGLSVEELKADLIANNFHTYQTFCRMYPALAAGAIFDPYGSNNSDRVVEILTELATSLKRRGWDGLIIIWDEFGRFLEERASEPFSRDAQLLQELAERCARSGENQLHLVLITHKSLRQYGRGLSGGVDKEWSKIEGRFSSVEVASDPQMVYRLIEQGLRPANSKARENYINQYAIHFDQLVEGANGSGLFLDATDGELRQLVVEGAYPLHPVATYCLPRLSDRVAQNQRTLFTFLVAEDENGLLDLWQQKLTESREFPLILPGQLFDYFAGGIRAATEQGGVHWVWRAVERARAKLHNSTDENATQLLFLIKTLAVLHIAQAYEGGAPSTELIAFCVGANTAEQIGEIDNKLERLAALRLIRYRKLYSGWEFVEWLSDLNIEQEVATRLQEKPPSTEMLRVILDTVLPPPVFQARRYNDHRGMIRYFEARYRTVAELEADAARSPNWEAILAEMEYTDGMTIYALAFTQEELDRAKITAGQISSQSQRVICVLPDQPLSARGSLEDLYGLQQLKSNSLPHLQEVEALKELEFFEQDTRLRLERAMSALIDPRQGANWFTQGHEAKLTSPGAVSRLLSQICEEVFSLTPRIYNESYNKRNPASVQLRAAEKVIEAFLTDIPGADLGLTGYGPDVAIMNSTLKATGILKANGQLFAPDQELYPTMHRVWQVMKDFYQGSSSNAGQEVSFEGIVELLQKPPYGLRRGVLPLLLAAAFKEFSSSATVRRSAVSVTVNGATFTDIVAHSSLYTIQIEQVSAQMQTLLKVLEMRVGGLVREEERKEQPLRYLSLGLLRWLQRLPRYARDSATVSRPAAILRRIIRSAANDPSRALLVDLPDLVDNPASLLALMDELEQHYENLFDRILEIVSQEFEGAAATLVSGEDEVVGLIANWYHKLIAGSSVQHLFSDPVTEELARIAAQPDRAHTGMIETLCKKVVGAVPRDWNDDLFNRFAERLAISRKRLEEEVVLLKSGRVTLADLPVLESQTDQLAEESDTEIVSFTLNEIGDVAPKEYRFKKISKLSPHGRQLAENLRRTIEISGRSLDIQEKRAIALELLRYIIEGKV